MKFKYLVIVLLILVSCTSLESNNSESSMTTKIVSDEVWHWCVGNFKYMYSNYNYLYLSGLTDQRNVEIDYTEIDKLYNTLITAKKLFINETQISKILDDQNIFDLNQFFEALELKDDVALEVCKIWFNMNNP